MRSSQSYLGKQWLLRNAKAVVVALKTRTEGTGIRVRIPSRSTATNTDGWSVAIGNLGKGKPRLEVWLDRFSAYKKRKLWACFSSDRKQIAKLAESVAKSLSPVRVITDKDLKGTTSVALSDRLASNEFHVPIREDYEAGNSFFGMYDRTLHDSGVSSYFCERAVDFFESVVRSLPKAQAIDEHCVIYPQFENRKKVASHLHRDRSGLLAQERKIKDDFTCQVCGLRFEEIYGKLGKGFAECHHLVPLSQLRNTVKTNITDLRTVCPNCHSMLHKMNGTRDDIQKLKRILRDHHSVRQ